LNQAFRRRIAHTGSTPDQYTVLRNLAESDPEGLTQTELTRRMTSDPNTIAALVDRMERAGLLERRVDPQDRRALRLRLQPAGRARYVELREIAQLLQNEVLEAIPARERNAFLARFARVANACRNAADAE
jgi:DNA-binding MarR family transcriptional regulator